MRDNARSLHFGAPAKTIETGTAARTKKTLANT